MAVGSLAAAALALLLASGSAAAGDKARPGSSAGPQSASSYVDEQRQLEEESAKRSQPVPADKLAGIHRRWFAALLRPRLETARRDAGALLCFIQEYWIWNFFLRRADARLMRPPGSLVRLLAGERRAALSAIVAGYTNAARRCAGDHGPSRAWLYLHLYDHKDVVGGLLEEERVRGPDLGELARCLHYEVTFRSILDGRPAEGGVPTRIRHDLAAKVLVAPTDDPPSDDEGVQSSLEEMSGGDEEAAEALRRMLPPNLRLASACGPDLAGQRGCAARLVSEWRSSEPGFGDDSKEPGVSFEVLRMDVDLSKASDCRPPREPRWFLSYEIHQSPLAVDDFLTFYWRDFHRKDSMAVRGSMNGYLAADFDKGSGNVLIRKTYRQTKPAGGYLLTEDTRIEVRHTPR